MNVPATLIAGLDEVGRGCIAGPVYAAAVIFPPGRRIRGLDDSKKLSAQQREALVPQIKARAIAWALGVATLEEIERVNILGASLLAMQRAMEALPVKPALAKVDGVHAPALCCPVETIIGGDAKFAAIMAASVLAKVARDAEMRRLDGEHPGYGFAQHKGYFTEEHQVALRELGPCPIHRRLFLPVLQMELQLTGLGIRDREPGVSGTASGGSCPANDRGWGPRAPGPGEDEDAFYVSRLPSPVSQS